MNNSFKIIVAGFFSLISFSAHCGTNNASLTVSAWIDGKSQLVISTNYISWHHIAFLQPGRSDGHNDPTYLDGFAWFPQWPVPADEQVSCSPLGVIASFPSNTVSLVVETGRDRVEIVQQPDVTNGHTLIVEFDDGVPGAAWYSVTLNGLALEYQSPLSIRVECVSIGWFARTNRIYQLQYATNVVSPTWQDVGPPVPGYGTNVSVVDCALDGPSRFYRTIVVP